MSLEEIAMLKKILIGLAVLILGFVVVVALQPSEFQMERSTKIAAPAADIFPLVNDFHKWDSWSPWAKLDPDAKISFEGPESGQGAAMSWAGNDKVGEGKMTVVESQPNDAVKLRVDFVKPFEGTSNSDFALKPGILPRLAPSLLSRGLQWWAIVCPTHHARSHPSRSLGSASRVNLPCEG